MKRTMICIACPIGCELTVEVNGDEATVSGNRCNRGEVYGLEEIRAPKRTVTATVALGGGRTARLPVKTDGPVAKKSIQQLLTALYGLEVTAPVHVGDIIVENFLDSGISVIATGEGTAGE